jgi:hypothetical protein
MPKKSVAKYKWLKKQRELKEALGTALDKEIDYKKLTQRLLHDPTINSTISRGSKSEQWLRHNWEDAKELYLVKKYKDECYE